MLFDSNAAKKMIEKLLENDVSYYKKWLGKIKDFNGEQIDQLLDGNINFDYHLEKESFQDLVVKFDNFKLLTQEWYNKEDYYKYLIPLWKNYICIEALKKYNEKKRTEYLKHKSINISEWPNNVKEEFNRLLNETKNTKVINKIDIYNKRSTIEKLIKKLNDAKKNFEINEKKNKEIKNDSKKKEKKPECNSVVLDIISNKMVKGLLEYLGPIAPIYGVISKAIDYNTDINNKNNEGKLINFEYNEYSNDYDYYDTDYNNIDYNDSNSNDLDSNDLINEDELSLSNFFGNKIVITIHATLSLMNLIESVTNFIEIKEKIEVIKKNNHEENINSIVSQFNDHIQDINKLNFDCNISQINNFIEQINIIIKNIQSDHEKLIKELETIRQEIEYLSQKEKESKIGTVKSLALGAFGIAGLIATSGISGVIYGISTLANGISGALNGINWYSCHKNIKKLEEYEKRVLAENIKFTKAIEDLESKIKYKSMQVPDYLDNVERILNEHKEIKN